MNLILLPEQAPVHTLPASDPRFEHVRGVLRCRKGDSFMVGAVNGPRGDATVEHIDRDEVRFSVRWDTEPMPPPPDIHLLLATPRPATARKILFEATALGIRRFHFFPADRSDPAYAKSSLWQNNAWQEPLWRGAEQAFSTFLPEVILHAGMAEALNGLPAESTRAALDVYEATTLLSRLGPPRLPLILALGGERGWSAHERTLLRAHRFTLASLGDRVLRMETAVTVAIAVSFVRLGRF